MTAFGAQIGLCLEHILELQSLERNSSHMQRSLDDMTAIAKGLPQIAQCSTLDALFLGMQKMASDMILASTCVTYKCVDGHLEAALAPVASKW